MLIKNSRPVLFERPGLSIWQDPYIQQQLLEAQLDISTDAASRNIRSIERTIDFIMEHTPSGSPILDLGCGAGLYASRLKKKGYEVTGIDFNGKAIEYARQQNPDMCYIHGDYLCDFPQGCFDVIIMIYCDMGALSGDEQDLLLSNCYHGLKSGGKLIFDVFNEAFTQDKKEGHSWEYFRQGGFWSEEEHVILSQTFHYPEKQVFAYQYNLILKKETRHFILYDTYYTGEKITGILKKAGFKNIRIKKGLLEGNDFTSNNQFFIVTEKI